MKRLLYVFCGLFMPLIVGICVPLLRVFLGLIGVKGYLYLAATVLTLIFIIGGSIWLQRALRLYAGIKFNLANKLLVYALALAWWAISIVTIGANVAAIATLSREKQAIVGLIRNCWIVSRIKDLENPTFSDMLNQQTLMHLKSRKSFYNIMDPSTGTNIMSPKASKSSCFDIYAAPIPLTSSVAPKFRVTLPDIEDRSAAKPQNMTESILLKGKNLNTRPWNRIKPDYKNLVRICSSPLGIGCDESFNNRGRAW